MDNTTEDQDSLNTGGEQDTTSASGSDEVNENLTKAKEYGLNQKIRAEKAEKEAKALAAELAKHKTNGESDAPKQSEKSNEPDYAKLAFLRGEGVKHPDDQKIVLDEAVRLKLPITDILEMAHIKAKLKDSSDQREAESGAPKGKGKAGGGAGKQDVDYWVDQKNPDGTYKTPEDTELAGKVIQARIGREERTSQFDPIRI